MRNLYLLFGTLKYIWYFCSGKMEPVPLGLHSFYIQINIKLSLTV